MLKSVRPFAKRWGPTQRALLEWVHWCVKRRPRRRSARGTLKKVTVLAYMRQLRAAWIRAPALCTKGVADPGKVIWWQDVRRHLMKEARKEEDDPCTPLNEVQYRQLLELAVTKGACVARTVLLLGCVGAARTEELQHPAATIAKRAEAYDLIVFPKGGSSSATATPSLSSLPLLFFVLDVRTLLYI